MYFYVRNNKGMIREKIEELRRTLDYHNHKYYVENSPEISDREFDVLMRELQELEAAHPEYADPNSPTARVGSDLTTEFQSVEHRFPMLSLGNTYSLDELHEFIGRIEKELGQTEFVCELKFDGTAISLTYEHGALLRAVTRGDGTRGDDVTANIRTIRTIPLHLQGGDYPDFFEIRGEVLMPYASFDRLNREREENGEPLLANPRNAAAGTLKQQSSAVVAQRGLDCTLYQLAGDDLPCTLGVYAESQRMGIQRIGQDADLPQPGGDRRLHRLLGRRAQETAVRYGRRGHQGQRLPEIYHGRRQRGPL